MGEILRSAARAGADPPDAATNPRAAVLGPSDVLIARLNATHLALAQRDRRARPRGPSTRERGEQISGECGANATDSHSRRFFSQSSRYLRAMARSLSLAWASPLLYISVIQASSGPAASLATMNHNRPTAACL